MARDIVSLKSQEQRQRQAERRIGKAMQRAEKEVKEVIEARAKEADLRKEDVRRRIEEGGVDPRPLPGLREDSLESMESMESMESSGSMKSLESADYSSGVSEEAKSGGGMMEDMPLEGKMPIDPEDAEEDLAQRVTEDTGGHGDPHEHNESKADELSKQMTEDTGADGDMNLHAERKVEELEDRMSRS